MKTKILLIRHAMTDTAGKRITGRSPGIFLNEQGRQQARYLVNRLETIPIQAIYCSPMERALETAGPLADTLNLPIKISEDFTETDFGEWTNFTIEELKNIPLFRQFNTYKSSVCIPGGEYMAEVQLRMILGFEKIHGEYPDQTVVVISHADPIKCALAWYAGIHMDLMDRIRISPASLNILELYEETARINLINDTGVVQ